MDLTTAQWKRLEPLLPKPRRRPDGRGRPWRDPRDVLNGVLWVLREGGAVARSAGSLSAVPGVSSPVPILGPPWGAGPSAPPTGPRVGGGRRVRLHRNVHRCDLRGREKRGLAVGLTRKGQGTKIMALADGAGLPLAVAVASANPSEISLVDDTLKHRFLRQLPTRIIGDRGDDSDALDARLAKRGIEFIAPHRSTRRHKTQDGRP